MMWRAPARWSLLPLAFAVYAAACAADAGPAADPAERPNIVWLTSEDNGQEIGAYGDPNAITPNIDALARRGMRYRIAWSNAPVCAPARTTIISGMWAPSIGAEHMRSRIPVPEELHTYPTYLRAAGYYTSNRVKEDFNIELTEQLWDDHGQEASWHGRESGQPFFAIFNSTRSHESRIRDRTELDHDPADLRLPSYHPDTPEVRRDWAQYYQGVTNADVEIGDWLAQLEASGEAENTIVFYYGDHGSGMPRSKRFPYNSGLEVPLIVYFPEKWQHLAPPGYQPGGASDEPVAFVDLAPTVLSLAGIEPPEHMHGRPLMGHHATDESQRYLYGFRHRMDERYDLIRSVRDERYVYIRNYMPHRIYGQHVDYMFETETTRVWGDLYAAGELEPPQTHFWEPKPVEELYDLWEDDDEINNLARSPEHQDVLERLREVNRVHLLQRRDLGFLPEPELHIRTAEAGATPYDIARDDTLYPMERIMETAELASSLDPEATSVLSDRLDDPDSAVRYWAATGLLMRGEGAVLPARERLFAALSDEADAVRIAAAEALGRHGNADEQQAALEVLLELADMHQNLFYTTLMALNAIDFLDARSGPIVDDVASLPRELDSLPDPFVNYVPRLIEHIRRGTE